MKKKCLFIMLVLSVLFAVCIPAYAETMTPDEEYAESIRRSVNYDTLPKELQEAVDEDIKNGFNGTPVPQNPNLSNSDEEKDEQELLKEAKEEEEWYAANFNPDGSQKGSKTGTIRKVLIILGGCVIAVIAGMTVRKKYLENNV